MRGGLATSIALHAAILGWALFTIQAQRELRVPEPEPIAVDLVNASDLTKLRQGVSNEELADLVIALREDDRLCQVGDESEMSQEPQLICSLGLFSPGKAG